MAIRLFQQSMKMQHVAGTQSRSLFSRAFCNVATDSGEIPVPSLKTFRPFKYKEREPGSRIKLPNFSVVMLRPPRDTPANQCVFRVPMTFNKFQIKNYLEEIYKIKVLKVNTLIMVGKTKTYMGQNKGYGRMYKKPDFKKAYVTLDEVFEWPLI